MIIIPARALRLSTWMVSQVILEADLYPFHLQTVQELRPQDFRARRQFCRWLIRKIEEDPNFLRRTVWTDEGRIERLGLYNSHNQHIYAVENPHARIVHHHQVCFSIER